MLSCGTNYQTTAVDQWTSVAIIWPIAEVNFAQATGNAFWITGVQLEKREERLEFEHRSHGEELALCQRYFQRKKLVTEE